MEMASIGFLLGAITAIIFVGIGVCFGRSDKGNTERELADDTDTSNVFDDRGWDRCRDHRCLEQLGAEEVTNTLQTIRIGATRTEKEALDYACECIHISSSLYRTHGKSRNYLERTLNKAQVESVPLTGHIEITDEDRRLYAQKKLKEELNQSDGKSFDEKLTLWIKYQKTKR